jgi:hypothetical protein
LHRCRASSAGAVAPQRPQVQGWTWFARTWRGRRGAAERARVAPRPAHGRAPPTHVLGTASSPAHRVRSCGHMSVQ